MVAVGWGGRVGGTVASCAGGRGERWVVRVVVLGVGRLTIWSGWCSGVLLLVLGVIGGGGGVVRVRC